MHRVHVMTRPKWTQSLKVLRDYAKGRKLKMRAGGKFRVVFIDQDTPLGEVWMRPHFLHWDNNAQIVLGRFLMVNPFNCAQAWFALKYVPAINGFAFTVPPEFLDIVFGQVDGCYEVDEAVKVQEKLAAC